ncbi:MAG: thioredoxin [Alphaproteobacteria bacterium]|nr:thioredoxin [Alphaproteobacteria bacterium]
MGAGPTPQGQSASPNALIADATTATFMRDVIEASMQTPVIVDFWAPWCGPCKQLTPMLEKAVTGARGAVRLVKVNIDENPEIAQQLRIQSIPAVYAFNKGQPVDGFVGALPESQIKQFVGGLAKLGGGGGPSPVDEMLAAATEALAARDLATAAQAYAQILQAEPDNVKALAGLARCYLESGDKKRAQDVLARVPEAAANDPDVAGVAAALALAEKAGNPNDVVHLREKVAHNPADHQSRYELAMALLGAGAKEAAIEELIEIVRRDREWEEAKARKELVNLFEAMGAEDPLTLAGRRKLSTILFS